MGNCCKTASSADWAGDDWGSLTSKRGKTTSSKVFDDVVLEEKDLVSGLLMGANNNDWNNACDSSKGKKVVKIRISKKELQQILEIDHNKNNKKKHIEGIITNSRDSAQHVLLRLFNHHYHHHHHHWRPVLQTIPEIN